MGEASHDSRKMLGVKEVAEITSLPPATIRYYDQQFEEFLGIRRGPGRRRLFSLEAVERINQVRRLLKDEGLSIRQARQRLAGGPAAEAAPAQDIQVLRERVRQLEEQVSQLKEIQVRTLALVEGLTGKR